MPPPMTPMTPMQRVQLIFALQKQQQQQQRPGPPQQLSVKPRPVPVTAPVALIPAGLKPAALLPPLPQVLPWNLGGISPLLNLPLVLPAPTP